MNNMYLLSGMAAFALCVCCISYNCFGKKLTVGDAAPDFTLIDEAGKMVTLSKLKGTKVALYFYPKNNTPGCTAQACSIRDSFKELKHLNIALFGISHDSPKSHQAFKEKHNLPFPLLSAHKKVLCAYGVNGLLFTTRRTFLINEKGYIHAIIKKIDVAHHAQQIIDAFQ